MGETIEVSATFSTAVDVDGTPSLGMWVGNWKAANYLRGSGADTLVFGYTVRSEDSAANGISMDGGYQDRNGTWHNFVNHTAVTASGNYVGLDGDPVTAYRVYRGLDQQSGHKVDGSLTPIGTGMEITSEPADGAFYRYGESIDIALTLSTAVDVEENLIEAIDEDLKTAGPNFDFELWQPASKNHREIPDSSQGCQWRRNVGPLGRSKTVSPSVFMSTEKVRVNWPA